MRLALLACLLLTACSSVEVAPQRQACVTSIVCPEGQRCDDGACVDDTSCPPAMAPEVVYTQADGDLNSNLVVLGGREYWTGPNDVTPASAGTETWFVDLATKATSKFVHPLGWGGCGGDPVVCFAYPQDGGAPTMFTGVHLDKSTQAWVSTASFPVPIGYTVLARDQPSAGKLLLWNADQHTVAVWDPPSDALDPLIVFTGWQPLAGVIQVGMQPRLLAALSTTSTGTTVAVVPLEKGGAFTNLLGIPGGIQSAAFPIPSNGAWFVVHDVPGGDSTLHVWRVDDVGPKEVGKLDDPLAFPVAATYRLGSPPLEGGSRGKGATCEADGCRTGRVDFATATVAPIGSATVTGAKNLAAAGTRWLACDTAEVLAEDVSPNGLTVYRVRVQANAGK